ncbi:MAG: hypothetical protein P4M15_15510 [Alphaproteobacteria bacterium]|nr:hypothetical protein [Alphaproteobacteria bacterium]
MAAPSLHASPQAPLPLDFEELLQTLDEQFAAFPSIVERFSFELDGIAVELRRIAQIEGHRFLIVMTLGHLPFSIESVQRRDTIKAIVDSARTLPHARFAIDYAGKITVGGLLEIQHLEAPDFIFYPLVMFLQEARPFIRLIGQYMPASAAPKSPV